MIRFPRHPSGLLLALGLALAPAAPSATAPDGGWIQGVTEPYRSASISPDLASRITSVRINEGGRARKGDTILVLDAEEAELEARRSRLIAENDAELTEARLKAEMAQRDLVATKMIYDSTRSVSKEEFLKKELEFNLTKAEVDRLTMAKKKSGLEYQIALKNLRRYFVIAPYDGIVAQRFFNEAETCKPQEALIHFVDVSRCRLVVYIPVARTRGLAKGQRLSLTVGDPGQEPRTGTLEFLSPVVHQASGLRTAKIVFDNPDGAIQPGVPGFLRLDK